MMNEILETLEKRNYDLCLQTGRLQMQRAVLRWAVAHKEVLWANHLEESLMATMDKAIAETE